MWLVGTAIAPLRDRVLACVLTPGDALWYQEPQAAIAD
jgi:hypothetical protein